MKVYLKGILTKTSSVFVVITILMLSSDCISKASSTKIAYKKPIYSKPSSNTLKEARIKLKQTEALKPQAVKTNTSTTTSTTTAAPVIETTMTHVSQIAQQQISTTNETATDNITTEISKQHIEEVENTLAEPEDELEKSVEFVVTTTTATSVDVLPTTFDATTIEPTTTLPTLALDLTTTTESSLPVPCTCGIFLASQIQRVAGQSQSPIGNPAIVNELDRNFACNSIGQKQCQAKCLETIVQYLPNSANILCATLDHDCRKERAYLFIKNCRNQWLNTNLQAGREYCCKDGKPYTCPLV